MKLKIRVLLTVLVIVAVVVFFLNWLWVGKDDNYISYNDYQSKINPDNIYLNAQQSYEEIKSTGFKPRHDVDPWPYAIPVDWSADPFSDSNWKFQLHAWRGVDPIIVKYLETRSDEYFHEAVSFARDWYRFHAINDPSDYSWYDMSAGIRAMRIAFFLDEAYAGRVDIDQTTIDMLNNLAEQHISRLMEKEYINRGNHGLFQIFGLNMLCSVVETESCNQESSYSKKMLAEIISKAYTDQGVHKEHSPYYHDFTIRVLQEFDAEQIVGQKISKVIRNAKNVSPWLAWPNGRYVEIGDSEGRTEAVFGDVNLTCLDNGACYAVGDFTDSGYATIRSNPHDEIQNSMLFMTGMSYSRIHKHVDELSFTLFEHGRQIFIDSGKYGYSNDKWRDYVLGASSHNTVSLLDVDIGRESLSYEGSYLDSLRVSESGFKIVGKVERKKLFTQEREVIYHPGKHIKIRDTLLSDTDMTYVSSLHVSPDLEPIVRDNGFDIDLANGHVIQARLQEEDCFVDVTRGLKEPVLGWSSVGYKEMKPTSVVRAICSGSNRSITWDVEL
ncbi:heparinase II/III domain-containing protein [Pistricoccus aurantiacus]|uniref:heparinase II/III domain-containing protein n=1 Tax=Pistricoccus aurantiacus TaxID=1883414 RepID=UPI0036392840